MIKTETLIINGKQFVRTYSDAGRYVLGGEPYGEYTEACDLAEFGRTYTEGGIIPPIDSGSETSAQELLNIILGN